MKKAPTYTARQLLIIKMVHALRKSLGRDPSWVEICQELFPDKTFARTAAAALVLNAWGGTRRTKEFRIATGVRGRASGGAGQVRNIPPKRGS